MRSGAVLCVSCGWGAPEAAAAAREDGSRPLRKPLLILAVLAGALLAGWVALRGGGVEGPPREAVPVGFGALSLSVEPHPNPGFERGSLEGWTAHRRVGDLSLDRMPGYGVVERRGSYFAGIKPFEGDYFFSVAADGATKNGALATGLVLSREPLAGERLRLRVKCVLYWTATGPGDTAVRVGLDPHGGTDPWSDAVVWGEWATQPEKGKPEWLDAVVEYTFAEGDSRYPTVFVEYKQVGPTGWHITAVDALEAEVY